MIHSGLTAKISDIYIESLVESAFQMNEFYVSKSSVDVYIIHLRVHFQPKYLPAPSLSDISTGLAWHRRRKSQGSSPDQANSLDAIPATA